MAKQTSSPPPTTSQKSFTLGVLLFSPTQLLDLSPTDLFGMLTSSYLAACNLPAPLLALGIPVTIHYISPHHQDPPTSPTLTFPKPNSYTNMVELTSSAHLLSTASLITPSVQPGALSALLIPGPDPALIPSEAEKAFIHAHYNTGTTDILTVCTGIFPAGYAGILAGHDVTGPRALVGELRGKFAGARWLEKRWVYSRILTGDGSRKEAGSESKNGNEGGGGASLWTSAGITNGLDMVAAYLHYLAENPRTRSRYGITVELADLVCRMADVGDRGQEYDVGKTREAGWWVWLILRSWWRGGGGTGGGGGRGGRKSENPDTSGGGNTDGGADGVSGTRR